MKINPRIEIISLMRGFFICPILSFFLKNDLIKIFFKKEFSIKDFKIITNKKYLKNIFLYMSSLGIIIPKKEKYKTTDLGKKILSRAGSFLILHSYKPYINDLESLLIKRKNLNVECVRKENVLGSGSINNKKFFPNAINLIKKENIGLIADIGCGDGNYLLQASKKFPNAKIFASDISKIAVSEARKKLKKIKTEKKFFTCDATNVFKWSNEIKKIDINKNEKVLISIWFILHEISKNKISNIKNFFKKLFSVLPNAIILIGEISNFDLDELSKNKAFSIMPEFLFFHNISGQGVIDYFVLKKMLKEVPQKLKKELKFDVIKNKKNAKPSAFIWKLERD